MLMRRLRRIALLIGLSAAAACGGGPTTPDKNLPIAVSVQALPTFVADPTTGMFALRVDNTSAAAVDLTFPSSCQLLPYFVDRRTGQAVTPRGGGTACLAVITRLTLVPGESFIQPVTVRSGDAPSPPFVVLPPGDYAIYARLEDQTYHVKSAELPFTLR
jgi:hypothetical protein